jgi:hypothetical protein
MKFSTFSYVFFTYTCLPTCMSAHTHTHTHTHTCTHTSTHTQRSISKNGHGNLMGENNQWDPSVFCDF